MFKKLFNWLKCSLISQDKYLVKISYLIPDNIDLKNFNLDTGVKRCKSVSDIKLILRYIGNELIYRLRLEKDMDKKTRLYLLKVVRDLDRLSKENVKVLKLLNISKTNNIKLEIRHL